MLGMVVLVHTSMGLVSILVMQWFKSGAGKRTPILDQHKNCYFRVLYRVKIKGRFTAVVLVQMISKREKQGLGLYWLNIKHHGVLLKQNPVVYQGEEQDWVVYNNLYSGSMLFLRKQICWNWIQEAPPVDRDLSHTLNEKITCGNSRSHSCEWTSSIRNITDMPICYCCSINQHNISRVSFHHSLAWKPCLHLLWPRFRLVLAAFSQPDLHWEEGQDKCNLSRIRKRSL